MDFNRRQFLAAASATTIVAATPSLAATPMPLSAPSRISSGAALSQRSVINTGFVSGGHDYRFIDHFLIAEQFGPVSGSGPTWMQSIGSNGYPNISIKATDNRPFGGGVSIPASVNYGAVGSGQYYVLRWKGNGD